jgi:hypothetical protein
MRIAGCMIFALLTGLTAGCQNRLLGPFWKEGEVAWGEAVNGLRVGLAPREYQAGKEPGPGQRYFGLKLRNETRRKLKVLWPLKPRFGEQALALKGDESVAVVLEYETEGGVKTARFEPPKRPLLYIIEPGEEQLIEVRVVPEKFEMKQFAAGRVTAAYENRQAAIDYGGPDDEPVSGIWTGRAASGSVEVTDQ